MEPWGRGSSTALTSVIDTVAVRDTRHDATVQREGYDLQYPAVLRNVPPPTIRFGRPLRWWSLDRQRRRAMVMHLRDRLLDDIMRVGARNVRDQQETQ